eukprot:43022-Eustigmatos_ZCMA.PRE.1
MCDCLHIGGQGLADTALNCTYALPPHQAASRPAVTYVSGIPHAFDPHRSAARRLWCRVWSLRE